MAELPEITKISTQMRDTLRGKTIQTVSILQEKCVNIPADEFQTQIAGAKVADVRNKGKWIVTSLSNGEQVLLSLGMGADILFFENEANLLEKYQIKLRFTDGSGYTARFWWFGKFALAAADTLDIGIDPFDERFTPEYFANLLKGKKTQIKAFLMDQKNVGGIGNMYMHDILFGARLHPQRKISDMSGDDIERLYKSMVDVLNLSRYKGAFMYENDFFGQKGTYGMDDFLVGYKENQPCPVCGEKIINRKTGNTSTFICPACQKL
ncbi:MAG: hypothetical protein FWF15_00785 [Oscillospiraceae bacterium]|nr:hypothetical protein [Oscillospiraceae bacterium]